MCCWRLEIGGAVTDPKIPGRAPNREAKPWRRSCTKFSAEHCGLGEWDFSYGCGVAGVLHALGGMDLQVPVALWARYVGTDFAPSHSPHSRMV